MAVRESELQPVADLYSTLAESLVYIVIVCNIKYIHIRVI